MITVLMFHKALREASFLFCANGKMKTLFFAVTGQKEHAFIYDYGYLVNSPSIYLEHSPTNVNPSIRPVIHFARIEIESRPRLLIIFA